MSPKKRTGNKSEYFLLNLIQTDVVACYLFCATATCKMSGSSSMKQLFNSLPDCHKQLVCPWCCCCAALKGCSLPARPGQLMDVTLAWSGLCQMPACIWMWSGSVQSGEHRPASQRDEVLQCSHTASSSNTKTWNQLSWCSFTAQQGTWTQLWFKHVLRPWVQGTLMWLLPLVNKEMTLILLSILMGATQ